MKAIASFFLKAKHWHIFLLLFVVPTIAEIAAYFYTIRSWHDLETEEFIFSALMTMLYLLCTLAWLGSLGMFFHSGLSPELRMSARFFYFSLVYPVAYTPLFFVWVPSDVGLGFPDWVVVLFHLLCMGCLFYVLYFVAKGLALLESGKPVPFYKYAGPFFLLWFFPLGVWIIQPKVNRLYAARGGAEIPTAMVR